MRASTYCNMKTEYINVKTDDYGALETSVVMPESVDSEGNMSNEPKCTVFEATCNLVTLVTGAGMLCLPYTAVKVGWFASVLLVVMSLGFIHSYSLLGSSIDYCVGINYLESLGNGVEGTPTDKKTEENDCTKSDQSLSPTTQLPNDIRSTPANIDYLALGKISLGNGGVYN